MAGGLWSHTAEGRTDDLASAQIVTDGTVNGQPMRSCQVAEGIKKHKFGDGLTEVEKKWVVSELATFLKSVNPAYRWVAKGVRLGNYGVYLLICHCSVSFCREPLSFRIERPSGDRALLAPGR